jgi:hypothetical protein
MTATATGRTHDTGDIIKAMEGDSWSSARRMTNGNDRMRRKKARKSAKVAAQ